LISIAIATIEIQFMFSNSIDNIFAALAQPKKSASSALSSEEIFRLS
jgi:hypothetical protein